jgi:Methyltransferase domain
VEVGLAAGVTTAKLLEGAAEGDYVVHGVDPAPSETLDLDALIRDSDGRFVLHRERSLQALPRIREADVVLLDGDHNWYTVFNELQTLARVAAEERRDFPLTFLHDIDWPYGRRDLYFDPDSIPEEYRQPYARAGIVPSRRRLSDRGGFAPGHAHALREGGPRNGVRTALEDFIAEATFEIYRQDIPGFHGLSVIAPVTRLAPNAALRRLLDERRSGDWLAEQCRRVEEARVLQLVKASNLRSSGAGPTGS